MPIDPNDSAFPIPNVAIDFEPGLTKREYIATQILSAFLSSSGYLDTFSIRAEQVQHAIEFTDLLIQGLKS